MKLWSELFQVVVDMDYPMLVKEAKICYERIADFGVQYKGENNPKSFLIAVSTAAVAADRQFSVLEQSFIKDVLDIDEDVFFDYICEIDEPAIDELEKTIDTLSIEHKSELAYFLSLLCACDLSIAPGENELIRRLIA